MGQGVFDSACNRDGFTKSLHRGNGSCLQRCAIHNARIELKVAEDVRIAVVADGVIIGVVFNQANSGFNRIHGRTAIFQNVNPVLDADISVGTADNNHTAHLSKKNLTESMPDWTSGPSCLLAVRGVRYSSKSMPR